MAVGNGVGRRQVSDEGWKVQKFIQLILSPPFTYLPIAAVHGRPTVAWFGPLHATPFETAKGVSTLLLHVTELPGMACSWGGDRHVTVAAGTRDLKCHDYGTMWVRRRRKGLNPPTCSHADACRRPLTDKCSKQVNNYDPS